jgi:ABC-type multidrug transport system ATPase subunit
VLKALADEGRTIIMTIHQARSQLIKDFDNIHLLARGGALVYSGPTSEMLPWFSYWGFHCPDQSNPADFVLDLITIDLQEEKKEASSRQRVDYLIHAWKEEGHVDVRPDGRISEVVELDSVMRERNKFTVVLPLLLERSIINIMRNLEVIMARTMQVIGYALIVALFFAPLKNNYEAIQSRMVCYQHPT